jgi:eukaryotic-like serine/threonine-protein kinase
MKLSRELWLQVEPLFAVAIEMDESARAAWLAGLDTTHPEAAPVVRRMLDTHGRAEHSRELETVPKLAPSPGWSSAYVPGARIGPFELIRPLGRGGMGEVWLARQADGRIERVVALKLPTLNQQVEVLAERFRRERDFLAKLEHPNIARLYDAGVTPDGQPWLAMEFVEGLSLIEHAALHALSIAQRLALFRQVLAAVAHAHRHLVVHRDLKPANILIDASGQVKLLDFGIAKLIDVGPEPADERDLTRLGGRVMTLRYAAPEQVAAGTITTATDIYSLGVILHELVTGQAPYRAVREGKALTESALLGEDPALPSSVAPKGIARLVSGDLDAIILKAMRRDPIERYASVEVFDKDVLAHLEKRPVAARAGTWRYLAGRFAARHKLPLALASAVLVTLFAGLVMVDQQRRVAVAQKARAERHFASVRKLANSFMFDVHDAIESLPGSLKAREMLVNTALQYLDSLAAEAGNDPALALELAVAYRKIGMIEGESRGANTGHLSTSLANFGKAKRLFVVLDAVKPNDIEVLREHRDLSFVLARACIAIGDARWQGEIADTVKLAARVVALPGATSRDRAREATMMAEQAHLTTIKLGPSPELEALMAKALANLEALAREAPGETVVRVNLSYTYLRAGAMFGLGNRTPERVRKATEYDRKALAAIRTVLASKPDDANAQRVELSALLELVRVLSYAGEHGEADRTMSEVLALGAKRVARDPKNIEVFTDTLELLNLGSLAAFRVGDIPRAIRLGREALAQAARLPQDTQKAVYVRNSVAEAKSHLGAALLASAQSHSLDRGRRLALLTEARSLLVDAVAFLDQIRAEKLGSVDESEAKEIVDTLERCDAAIARLKAGAT